MKVGDTQNIDPSRLPLEMLAGNPNISDKEKIGEVARQFESVLLKQILSEARKSESSGGVASGIYDDMVNTQLADSISRSGKFGLAASLKEQLTRQVLPQSGSGPASLSTASKQPASKVSPHRRT